jgi:hypothetical protein
VVVGAASTIFGETYAVVLRPSAMPQLNIPFNLVTVLFLWFTFAVTRMGRDTQLAAHALEIRDLR